MIALTSAELAARIGRSVAWTQALLEEELRRGLVERDGNRWKLTDSAERRCGHLLREARP
jgi:hypothetical protein